MTAADRDVDLDALRALEAAATPGPWSLDSEDVDTESGDGGELLIVSPQGIVGWRVFEGTYPDGTERRDADFIAAARNALPDLLAENDRLRQWKAEAVEVMLGLQDLGKALGIPLGERITSTRAAEIAAELRAEVDRLRDLVTAHELEREIRLGLPHDGPDTQALADEVVTLRAQVAAVRALAGETHRVVVVGWGVEPRCSHPGCRWRRPDSAVEFNETLEHHAQAHAGLIWDALDGAAGQEATDGEGGTRGPRTGVRAGEGNLASLTDGSADREGGA